MKKIISTVIFLSSMAVNANPFAKVQLSHEFLQNLLQSQRGNQVQLSTDESNPFSKVTLSREFLKGIVDESRPGEVIEVDLSNPFSSVQFSENFRN